MGKKNYNEVDDYTANLIEKFSGVYMDYSNKKYSFLRWLVITSMGFLSVFVGLTDSKIENEILLFRYL